MATVKPIKPARALSLGRRATSLTIEGLLHGLFPQGYVDYAGYSARLAPRAPGAPLLPAVRNTAFDAPPCQAADLFVFAATLVQRSGAYHHVTPAVTGVPCARVRDHVATVQTGCGSPLRGPGAA